MNIFPLDDDLVSSALYHVDSHCSKIILECAQMISTAHHEVDSNDTIDEIPLYKSTHKNHPCSIWVRKTAGNYFWTVRYMEALTLEHFYRRGTMHKSYSNLWTAFLTAPQKIDPSTEITPFVLAMPDKYKIPNDPVQSYRDYYNGEKAHLFKWTRRDVPYWIEEK